VYCANETTNLRISSPGNSVQENQLTQFSESFLRLEWRSATPPGYRQTCISHQNGKWEEVRIDR